MSEANEHVQAILDEAEHKLLELVGECAKIGDLTGIDIARDAVGRIREITKVLDGQKGRRRAASRKSTNKKPQRGGRDTKPSKLPRFVIRGTTLCKIGWSKKKSEEYEHKVPEASVREVIDAIVALADSHSGPIAGDDIINKTNQRAAVSIPSYQVYVVIGWLRSEELIEQLGREGYRVSKKLRQEFDAIWDDGVSSEMGS